jgi:hypothetical protein
MSVRMAERYHGKLLFHVVRFPARYACGSVRHPEMVNEDAEAHTIEPKRRCLRVGCANDYAKADKAARDAALSSSVVGSERRDP